MTTPHSPISTQQKDGENPYSLPMLPMSDHMHQCVYRPCQIARMPLLYPTRKLTGFELDDQLALGRRRSGTYLYYTACPTCVSCEPTRVEVVRFQLSRSMKRVLKEGDRLLKCYVSFPSDDPKRIELFNRHRMQRALAASKEAYSHEDFRSFLVDTCCESRELSFWFDEKLIGCSIVDFGVESMSAVYSFFDPEFSHLSLGTYSILKQFALANEIKKKYLYLGMYVEDNQHLRYKGRFAPQERFIRGKWQLFEAPMTDWSSRISSPASDSNPT
jgi:leucyl-tRNA---protein transferase